MELTNEDIKFILDTQAKMINLVIDETKALKEELIKTNKILVQLTNMVGRTGGYLSREDFYSYSEDFK